MNPAKKQQSLTRRLHQELKQYNNSPVINTGVEPEESDFTLWNAVIAFDTTQGQAKMHLLIHYSEDYPTKAPSVGFSVHFPYNNGAISTIRYHTY